MKNNRKFNTQKKAQLEIIGLVFIVILVSMAMLFYLSYSVQKKDKHLYKQYADNELSVSYASVFTKMSICGTEMNKLMEDCVTAKRIVCDDGLDSCETVNKTILYLLDKTLNRWDKSYGFTIKWTDSPSISGYADSWKDDGENSYYFDDEKWVYTRRNCTDLTTGIKRPPGLSPIPVGTTGDTISVEVGMCVQ